MLLFFPPQVASILFSPGHLLSVLTLGSNISLVVDVGYKETLVVPVYEGIPIMKGWQIVPLGGKAIHNQIKSQLMEHGTISNADEKHLAVSSRSDSITEEILEDVKGRKLYKWLKLVRGGLSKIACVKSCQG